MGDRCLKRRAFLLAYPLLLAQLQACQPAAVPAPVPAPTAAAIGVYDPPRDLGQLFHDVQLARVFPDSKTFVDAKPRFAPADIVARYAVATRGAQPNLKGFVAENFEPPAAAAADVRSDTTQTMEEHIEAL